VINKRSSERSHKAVSNTTGDLSEDSNLKWVFNRILIASNRLPIWKTYFGCQEWYNPNLSILSPGDPFAEMVLFWVWVLLLERTKMDIELFTYSVTQT